MKNNFTANGFERWMNGRKASRREDVAAKLQADEQSLGCLGKIRHWWQIEVASWLRTREDSEKSSSKILW